MANESKWYVTSHALEKFQKRVGSKYNETEALICIGALTWRAVGRNDKNERGVENYSIEGFPGLLLRVSDPYPGKSGQLVATVVLESKADVAFLQGRFDELLEERRNARKRCTVHQG